MKYLPSYKALQDHQGHISHDKNLHCFPKRWMASRLRNPENK